MTLRCFFSFVFFSFFDTTESLREYGRPTKLFDRNCSKCQPETATPKPTTKGDADAEDDESAEQEGGTKKKKRLGTPDPEPNTEADANAAATANANANADADTDSNAKADADGNPNGNADTAEPEEQRRREALQTHRLLQLPPMLCLQLLRFDTARGLERRSDFVDFPFELAADE